MSNNPINNYDYELDLADFFSDYQRFVEYHQGKKEGVSPGAGDIANLTNLGESFMSYSS